MLTRMIAVLLDVQNSKAVADLKSIQRKLTWKNMVKMNFKPHTFSLAATAAMLGFVFVTVCPSSAYSKKNTSPPDANALVKRMLATYQKASSVQETTEAKIIIEGNSEYISVSSLKYKKPNFLVMNSIDHENGTMKTYVNGRLATIYSGKENMYTKRTADPSVVANLSKMLDMLSSASADVMGSPLHQVLAPIDFIAAKNTLKECKYFKYVREELVNGRKTILVKGDADIDWLKDTLGQTPTVPPVRLVLLWIDPVTNLLVKGGLRVTWRTSETAKKHLKIPPGIAFDEVHNGTILNAPIKDSEFQFFPPKNAIEKFQEHK